MIATATAIVLGGCASTTRFVVARTEPAPLSGVRRPSLAFSDAPEHPGSGQRLSVLLAQRLRAAGMTPPSGETSSEADASVVGWIELLAPDVGRVHVRAQVVPVSGGPASQPSIAVTRAPSTVPELLDAAAAELAVALLPLASESVTIEWEEVGDWDEDARAHMAAGQPREALSSLEDALPRAKAAVGAEALASLYYDLGVCLDLVGRTSEAERAFDEALTLHGSERHLSALRDVRRRKGAGR